LIVAYYVIVINIPLWADVRVYFKQWHLFHHFFLLTSRLYSFSFICLCSFPFLSFLSYFFLPSFSSLFITNLFSWGVTESTWYCNHCLAYCTSPRW
jgi:hypothetical protein